MPMWVSCMYLRVCSQDAREQGRRREGKEESLRKLLESRNLQSVQQCVGEPLHVVELG